MATASLASWSTRIRDNASRLQKPVRWLGVGKTLGGEVMLMLMQMRMYSPYQQTDSTTLVGLAVVELESGILRPGRDDLAGEPSTAARK